MMSYGDGECRSAMKPLLWSTFRFLFDAPLTQLNGTERSSIGDIVPDALMMVLLFHGLQYLRIFSEDASPCACAQNFALAAVDLSIYSHEESQSLKKEEHTNIGRT